MKFAKQSFTVFLCTVLVAACSGSGDGSVASTPTSMAKIDVSSAATIAGGVVDAVFASGSFSDVVGGGGSGSLVGKSVPIPETTTQCFVDGSVTVSGQVLDLNTLSDGDQLRLEFFDCNDGAGQVLNGIYEIVINSFSGDLLQGLVDLNATVTFDGFEVMEGSEMTSLNGVFTLDLDTSMPPMASVSVSGASVSVSDNTASATLSEFQTDVTNDARVIPEAYTLAASSTLTSTLFEGAVNYSIPVPFQGFAGQYPYQGELLVTGADGSSVRLMALDNMNARLDIDPGDGSGIVTQETTWAEVASPLIADKTGIMGIVLRGPINPGPEIQGEINERPFRASFHVLDSGKEVAHFESDDNGNFRVDLLPGDYSIVADASAPILNPEQQTKLVTVPAVGLANVTLRFDTGIR
jgi:hypothetical protein